MSKHLTKSENGHRRSDDQSLNRTYTISNEKRLGQQDEWDIIKDAVEHQGHIVILSPPNSGKSYAAIKGLRKLKKKFVFVADTKALAEDLASKHKLEVYHGGCKDIDTTQSFITIPLYAPNFASKEWILVVDEWHSLVTDYGYRGKHIEPFVDSFSKWKQVIGMTGTRFMPISEFPEWHVKYKTPRKVTIHHVSEYTDLASTIASSIQHNPHRQHWVSVFEKKKLPNKISELLCKNGFFKEEIVSFNSDTLTDDRVKQFLQHNVFPEKVKVVFTTFTQGFSINGNNYMLHIVPLAPDRRHSPLDFAQVSHRFRNIIDHPIINMYWKFPPKQKRVSSGVEIRKEWEREHKSREIYYRDIFQVDKNSKPSDDQIKLIRFIEKNKDFSELKLGRFQDMFRVSFKRNDIMLGYEIYCQNTRKAYSSFDTLKKTLKREYDCILKKGKRIPDLEETTSLKQRGIQDATFQKAIEQLKVTDDGKSDVNGRLMYLIRFMELEDAIIAYTSYSWRQINQWIQNQTCKDDEPKKLRESLKEVFKEGSIYSNQDIKSKLKLLSMQYTYIKKEVNKKYPVQFLKRYFSIVDRRQKGKRVHEVISHEPLKLTPLEGATDE